MTSMYIVWFGWRTERYLKAALRQARHPMARIFLSNVSRDAHAHSLTTKWIYSPTTSDITIYDSSPTLSKWIVSNLSITMLIKLEEFDDSKYMCVLWLPCKKLTYKHTNKHTVSDAKFPALLNARGNCN